MGRFDRHHPGSAERTHDEVVGDAPMSTQHPTTPLCTCDYKLRILAAYDRVTGSGEKGALLCREGPHSSHLPRAPAAREAGLLHRSGSSDVPGDGVAVAAVIFSRKVIAWMGAPGETAGVARTFIADTVKSEAITADTRSIHADRGHLDDLQARRRPPRRGRRRPQAQPPPLSQAHHIELAADLELIHQPEFVDLPPPGCGPSGSTEARCTTTPPTTSRPPAATSQRRLHRQPPTAMQPPARSTQDAWINKPTIVNDTQKKSYWS